MQDLKRNKAYKFHPKCCKLNITHLSFADDLLLFAREDQESVQQLHEAFLIFSAASGLQANLTKSAIYFEGVDNYSRIAILHTLAYVQGQLPFKYLGIPLDTKKLIMIQ